MPCGEGYHTQGNNCLSLLNFNTLKSQGIKGNLFLSKSLCSGQTGAVTCVSSEECWIEEDDDQV